MGDDSDIRKMLAFKYGDISAFGALFDRYKTRIVNYCHRFTNDRDAAEDLAQEVFLRVHRSASRYKPEAAFSTWIFKIATNVCLNELRKPKYRYTAESMDTPKTGGDDPPMEIADEQSVGPEAAAERKELDDRVRRAIAKLPPKQRAAVLLRIYDGFSYEEIAKQIGKSEKSVKALIHRGRNALKEELKDFAEYGA